MKPRISVVMPAYNGARYIQEALESLAAQTDSRWELVVSDHGSTDETPALLRAFRDRYPGQVNILPSEARTAATSWWHPTRRALAEAKGTWAQILHQDDLFHPQRFERVLAVADAQPGADLIYSAAMFINDRGRVVGQLSSPHARRDYVQSGALELERLVIQNYLAVPAVTFRLEAGRTVGFPPDALWFAGDWDLWLRILARPEARVGYLSEALASYRLHPLSQTSVRARDPDAVLPQLTEVAMRALSGGNLESRRHLVEANLALNAALAAASSSRLGDAWYWGTRFLRAERPTRWPELVRDSRVIARTLARLRVALLEKF